MKIFQNLYIKLNGYDIESFVERLAKKNGGNWKRAFEREENAKYFGEKAFAFECAGENGLLNAVVTLYERNQGVWYVPNIIPIEYGQFTIDEYNKILIDFKSSLVDPAVMSTPIDVELTKDQIFLEDMVSKKAADALKRFSFAANKSTGHSHPLDERRWFEFLLATQESEKKPSPDLLKTILMEQGWSEEWAYDLASEFEYSEKLLDFAKEA